MKNALFIIFFMFIACSTVTQDKGNDLKESLKDEDYPHIVAILPFESDDKDINIADQLRKTFYNHFSGKNYTNVELQLVDEKIYLLEKSKGKSYKDLSPKEICDAIGCDGLIYGKVTDYQKIYAVAYSQLGIEAEIIMHNVKSNKEVLRIKESVRYHEGGVPMSPLSAIMTAVTTALNLREIQSIRLLNELCYKITEKIPVLTGAKAFKLPTIKEVLTNVKESPFGKGKIIRVGLEGDSGMIASFDIGNFRKGIIMREIKPGVYTGEYVVMNGDSVKDVPIIVYLKRAGGYENRWIDVTGLLTIDTESPSIVKNIKVKGYSDKIILKWEPLKGTPDLRGYEILRSEQLLSGYKTVGFVEHDYFEDKELEVGKTYYYRVKAIDLAGNESELSEPVKAHLILKDPLVIDGVLNKDLYLMGIYKIREKLIIPKGIELRVGEGSVLYMGKEASILVEGQFIIEAENEYVEFMPEGEGINWEGISVKRGYLEFNKGKIKNALVGIKMEDSTGKITNSIISDSQRGIEIVNCSKIDILKTSIFNNKYGIVIEKSSVNMKQNEVFQNEIGINLTIFSGDIGENNIFNNGINITSSETQKISPNFFGSIKKEEMKVKNIIVENVYDRKIPEGKIVKAIIDPYIGLAEEERKKRSLEFLIDGGNYFRQRNYGKAVLRFEEALRAYPSPEIYYYIALCYKEMGELSNAIKYLEEGYEKFPKDSTIVKALGLVYYEKKDNERAIKLFEEVLKLNPEDNQIKFILDKIKGN